MKKEQTEPDINSQIVKIAGTIICWIVGHVFYLLAITIVAMGLVGDGTPLSGTRSAETIKVLSFGIFYGVVISGLAGFPLGIAVMLPRGKRKPVLKWFLGIFAAGVLMQIASFVYFFVI